MQSLEQIALSYTELELKTAIFLDVAFGGQFVELVEFLPSVDLLVPVLLLEFVVGGF